MVHGMVEQVRALIVEDSPADAARIVDELERGGYAVTHTRVDSASALPLVKAHDPELPLIIVANAAENETKATIIAAMRAGAADFFAQSDLTRLTPAVAREVRDAQHRRQRTRTEQKLRQSARLFATAFHANPTGIVLTRVADGRILDVNSQFLKITGYTRAELIGKNGAEINLWVSEAQRRELGDRLHAGETLENVEMLFRYGSGEPGVALLSTAHIELDGCRLNAQSGSLNWVIGNLHTRQTVTNYQ